MMHGRGKSDSAIVAAKPANKAERSAAEPVEPRTEAKGNAGQQITRRAQSRVSVSEGKEEGKEEGKGGFRLHECWSPNRSWVLQSASRFRHGARLFRVMRS